MPAVTVDGIETHYEVVGTGPPLLMFSPGGFDATLDKWTTLGIYARVRILHHLATKFRCVVFDRRETGQSGGRIEPITWAHYVAQGKGLLDQLGIAAAHVLGGCMGCCPAVAFGVKHPDAALSLVLYWPVGGAGFRQKAHDRFAAHLAVAGGDGGLAAVAALAKSTDAGFGKDPRVGPWAPVIRRDPEFADQYARFDVDRYQAIVATMSQSLFDRDTAPGAEPEDLKRLGIPALIIPGNDAVHTASAARYLQKNLPRSEYWDVEPDEQTEVTAPARIVEFLDSVSSEA